MCLFRTVLACAVLAAACQAASAGSWRLPGLVGATEQVHSDPRSGLALSGYDPVGYLIDGTARPGTRDHEATAAGLAWRFVSAANRDAFRRDAAAFMPRIGGYDAVAAAQGRIVDADPVLFVVRDGRLYLFRSEASRARFIGEPDLAAQAELGWAGLRSGLVAE